MKQNQLLTAEKIHMFPIELLQLEDDLLSMEQPRSFANHLLDDDDNYKVYVQQSI